MFNEPIHVSDTAFDRVVRNANLPLIVDFWAEWCGPCKMMEPVLKKIATEYAGKMITAKVNTEDYPSLAEEFHIAGIPTILFFVNGKEVERSTGALTEESLRQKISQVFGIF